MNAFAYVVRLTVFGYNQLDLYETCTLLPNTMRSLINREHTTSYFDKLCLGWRD